MAGRCRDVGSLYATEQCKNEDDDQDDSEKA